MEETKDGFVLDCSVTMAWCFDDESTAYTDSLQDQLGGVRAIVPTIWPLEVANAALGANAANGWTRPAAAASSRY